MIEEEENEFFDIINDADLKRHVEEYCEFIRLSVLRIIQEYKNDFPDDDYTSSVEFLEYEVNKRLKPYLGVCSLKLEKGNNEYLISLEVPKS